MAAEISAVASDIGPNEASNCASIVIRLFGIDPDGDTALRRFLRLSFFRWEIDANLLVIRGGSRLHHLHLLIALSA
jgi:hypothetical protein